MHLVVTRSVAGGPVTTMLDYTRANGVVGPASVVSGAVTYDGVADEVIAMTYSMFGTLNGGSITIDFGL